MWIISWKMVFLMVLLCKEAELPPRWRDGFSWGRDVTGVMTERNRRLCVDFYLQMILVIWDRSCVGFIVSICLCDRTE